MLSRLQSPESCHFPLVDRFALFSIAMFLNLESVHFPHFAARKVFTFHLSQPGKCSLSRLQNAASVHSPRFAALEVFTFYLSQPRKCSLSRLQNKSSVHSPGCKTWQVFTFRVAKCGKYSRSRLFTFQVLKSEHIFLLRKIMAKLLNVLGWI